MHRDKRPPCAFFHPPFFFAINVHAAKLVSPTFLTLLYVFGHGFGQKQEKCAIEVTCLVTEGEGVYFFSMWVTPQMPEVIQDFKWLGPHTHAPLHSACTYTHIPLESG